MKIKCRGGADNNMGGAGIKKRIGPKWKPGALLGLRVKKPNRSDLSEPDRFSIGYIKACFRFFVIFSSSFSFFPLSREREALPSL